MPAWRNGFKNRVWQVREKTTSSAKFEIIFNSTAATGGCWFHQRRMVSVGCYLWSTLNLPEGDVRVLFWNISTRCEALSGWISQKESYYWWCELRRVKDGRIKRNEANGKMLGGVSVNFCWPTAIKSLKWIKIRLTVVDKNLNLGFLQLLCYSSNFPLQITSARSIPFKAERQHHRHHLFSSYDWFERQLSSF